MDKKYKHKARDYKSLRSKHKQNTLDINHSDIFVDLHLRVMGKKTTHTQKQMGPN